MSDRHVLFLALGPSRARTVVADSARVVADGDTATVVVDDLAAWRGQRFAPSVRVIELNRLQQRHLPVAAAQFLVRRAPGAALRAIGRGPAASWSRRAGKAYERRVAERFHRGVFLPIYQRLWSDARYRVLHRRLARDGRFDLLVVADPLSIPTAARLATDSRRFAEISYCLEPATGNPADPASAGQNSSWRKDG